MEYRYLSDASFLKEVDELKLKYYYTRIIVLTFDEKVITEIQGRVLKGSSININGSSALRRTCNVNFLVDSSEDSFPELEDLLGINRKIIIEVGYENTTGKYNEFNILWFPQGVFVINQISITHNLTSAQISISCKDKMCLLNGEAGGTLPTSVTFSPRYQENEYGEVTNVPATFYELIQTAVCNFGGEPLDNIIISDVPMKIKQLCHYNGDSTLYYDVINRAYSTDPNVLREIDPDTKETNWDRFGYNEDVGYRWVDFVYPGELVCGMNSTVCTVLDEICKKLGNFEYYYDVCGKFIFREKKNYLNNSFLPDNSKRLIGKEKRCSEDPDLNNTTILDNDNYLIDCSEYTSSIYSFEQGNNLINSYTNAPNYENIKNDYHIWGKSKTGLPIHYHLSLQRKPQCTQHFVLIDRDDDGNPTNKITSVVLKNYNNLDISYNNGIVNIPNAGYDNKTKFTNLDNVNLDNVDAYTGQYKNNTIEIFGDVAYPYQAEDWRAELYFRGLEKELLHQRPDIYEQELLDNFLSIYEFKVTEENGEVKIKGQYKQNVFRPNTLPYWIDYIEPINTDIDKYSVDAINTRIYTQQQDSIKRIYDRDTPNNIILESGGEKYDEEKEYAEKHGDTISNVSPQLFSHIIETTVGYSAIEIARDALYQHLTFNNSISLQVRPIYYLEVNKRINVNDYISGICGDYIISSMTIPLDAEGTMSISAIKTVDRL